MVLDNRCSWRDLSPLTWNEISALLWYGARTRETRNDGSQHRAAPSAGGLHPIDIVVFHRAKFYLYDSMFHSVRHIASPSRTADELRKTIAKLVPKNRGNALLLVASTKVTAAKYLNCESLLWRDAGTLIATLGLCAEWLDLGFCALGILGTSAVRDLFRRRSVLAAGVCVVGRRHGPLSADRNDSNVW